MSPSFVGIVPSIEMVIYTAVGGRLSILGAVYGTMLVNFAKTSLRNLSRALVFGLAVFIAVVLAFPKGLAGIWGDYVQPRIDRLISSRKPNPRPAGPTTPSRRRAGRVRGTCMLIGHQPKPFLLRRGLTVSLTGSSGERFSFYVEEKRDPRHHRPNGAGKTTVPRPDLRNRPRPRQARSSFAQELTKLKGTRS